MYKYTCFREERHSDEFGNYITFGINATDTLTGQSIRVSDVSIDEKIVKNLCYLCTLNQLYPIHLYDVIEDNI